MSYLQDLAENLESLPKEDLKDALFYYEQYFDEGRLTDGQAVAEFGTPQHLARRIIADFYATDEASSDLVTEKKTPFGFSKRTILIICTSPILLPLLIAAIAVVFGMIVSLVAVVFSLIMIVAGFAIAVIISFLAGIVLFKQSVSVGLFYIFLAVTVLGILMMLLPLILLLVKWLKACATISIKWIREKVVRKQKVMHEL